MRLDANDFQPMVVFCLLESTEVIFCYNEQEVARRNIGPGYWYYWIAGNGACCVKQLY
jgi:hypothetical protein